MLISAINNTSFKGKIIESHAHTGHWEKPAPYFIEDIFEKADRVKQDGDEISKIIISNLDCIKEEYERPLLDEITGNKNLLNICKTNPRTAALAVCQPKTGNVRNIIKLFDETKDGFVGLKFHPLCANLPPTDARYFPYLKFAQTKKLPCLFHSQVNVDNNTGKLLPDSINVSDPELIYAAAKKAPQTPVILGHMGAGWGESHSKAVDIILQSIEKNDATLYADISWVDFSNPEKPNLISAIKKLMSTTKGDKTDRLLFGTDAPLAEYDSDKELYARVVRETKAAIRKNFGDNAEELIEKIFYQNSNKLFFENRNKPAMLSKLKIPALTLLGLSAAGAALYTLKDKLQKNTP